ncbi:UNVERIFIED_CONTAM: hypothetical protein Sradi_0659500 [Sesamum radiatum]|uniref:PLATZ transcription factor family protein n=1 Tax=Sesamum radiatum TaxID=300843 RepID=A0AAW2VQJ4_SESRA
MVMWSSSGEKPAWLESWLRIPFYRGEKCEKHTHQYNTVFCAICMGSPVCETCWKCHHSKLHQGHISLQVCSASRRAAIEIKTFKKHMDASDIQVYKINGKDIFYLKPCGEGVVKDHHRDHHQDHHHHHTHDPKCQTCRKKLKDSNYLFCSIDCKNMMMGNSSMISSTEQQQLQPMGKRKSRADTKECSSLARSMRKRSRKGIPSRAPFW